MGWDEREHPRDRRGRFAEKAGGRWASHLSDQIRGGSRYKRVEGKDRSTEVFDRAPELESMYRDDNGNGDAVLEEICRLQGFDGLPAVGTEAEVDDAIAEGGVELWRGVSGMMPHGGRVPYDHQRSPMHFLEQWRSGPLRQGSGIYGQGTYTSVDRRVAEAYGTLMTNRDGQSMEDVDPRSLSRMVLSPDARVIDSDDHLFNEYKYALHDLDLQPFIDLERRETLEYMEREGITREEFDPDTNTDARPNRWRAISTLSDWGRAAAAMGYDAIRVKAGQSDGSGLDLEQYVILNRTAVMVQEAYDESLLPPGVVRVSEVA